MTEAYYNACVACDVSGMYCVAHCAVPGWKVSSRSTIMFFSSNPNRVNKRCFKHWTSLIHLSTQNNARSLMHN